MHKRIEVTSLSGSALLHAHEKNRSLSLLRRGMLDNPLFSFRKLLFYVAAVTMPDLFCERVRATSRWARRAWLQRIHFLKHFLNPKNNSAGFFNCNFEFEQRERHVEAVGGEFCRDDELVSREWGGEMFVYELFVGTEIVK